MQRSSQVAQALSLVLLSLLMKFDVKRSVLSAKRSASANDRAAGMERCFVNIVHDDLAALPSECAGAIACASFAANEIQLLGSLSCFAA